MEGVTDSSEPSWFAPYGVVRVACRPVGIPGHSWGANASHGMSIGFKGMATAAKALAFAGTDLLTSPNILEEAKKEFGKRSRAEPTPPSSPRARIPHFRGRCKKFIGGERPLLLPGHPRGPSIPRGLDFFRPAGH